jgi:hypothetical protein
MANSKAGTALYDEDPLLNTDSRIAPHSKIQLTYIIQTIHTTTHLHHTNTTHQKAHKSSLARYAHTANTARRGRPPARQWRQGVKAEPLEQDSIPQEAHHRRHELVDVTVTGTLPPVVEDQCQVQRPDETRRVGTETVAEPTVKTRKDQD